MEVIVNSTDLLDSDGYPTEKALKTIEKWPTDVNRIQELFDFIESIWHFPEWGFVRKRKYGGYVRYELHTGGWSGNEDLIGAFRSNLLWSICWRMSKAGGHYYFRVNLNWN